jgi:hypothetical protein
LQGHVRGSLFFFPCGNCAYLHACRSPSTVPFSQRVQRVRS